MEKVKDILDYDSRRKVLTRKRIWNLDEKDIRKNVDFLRNSLAAVEQDIKKLKSKQKEAPEMTEELQALKEKVDALVQIEESTKHKQQLEELEKNRKLIKKDLDDIKSTIGDRLKL